MAEQPSLWGRLTSRLSPPVFFGSALLVILFVLGGSLLPDRLGAAFGASQSFISEAFGWYYVLAATAFLLFCLWLMVSRHGDIRLGADDERPEFGLFGWVAMLFTAGLGIGLVFYGVAEPMFHYMAPPLAEAGTPAAMRESLAFTFYHWGFHAWAIYIVLGLAMAYFHFRKGLPLAPRSVLQPLIGERYKGWIGHATDILCVVGTLLGVATSLGLGAAQVNSGLGELFGVAQSITVQVWLIVGITAMATVSVMVGIHHGIQRLAMFNMMLAGLLLVFVFIFGPTVFELKVLTTGIGEYLDRIIPMSFWLSLDTESEWQAGWTLFYWGWWISWAPFVGIFIARISRGRTIREFVGVVLFAPVFLTILWFSVFGGAGLWMETTGAAPIAEAINNNISLSLHALLAALPWPAITGVLATLLIVVFFVSSSDSGSLVIDMITSGGHPNPPRVQRLFWALAEGAVAIVLLVAGGLAALQSAAISAGLPMSLVLIAAVWSLFRALRREPIHASRPYHAPDPKPAFGDD